jgi:hypothetical protein
MAIAVQLDFPGATLDQYDAINKLLGTTNGGSHPGAGALFHFVTATEDGFRVVEVRNSREQFEAFIDNTIGPLTAQVGMTGPPPIQFLEIHNYYTAG